MFFSLPVICKSCLNICNPSRPVRVIKRQQDERMRRRKKKKKKNSLQIYERFVIRRIETKRKREKDERKRLYWRWKKMMKIRYLWQSFRSCKLYVDLILFRFFLFDMKYELHHCFVLSIWHQTTEIIKWETDAPVISFFFLILIHPSTHYNKKKTSDYSMNKFFSFDIMKDFWCINR